MGPGGALSLIPELDALRMLLVWLMWVLLL